VAASLCNRARSSRELSGRRADRNGPLDRKRNTAGFETLDDGAGKTVPAGLPGCRQMNKVAGALTKFP